MLVLAAAWSGPVFVTVRSDTTGFTPASAGNEDRKRKQRAKRKRLWMFMTGEES